MNNYLEASQEYISFLIDENKELRKKVKNYDEACQRIASIINAKPEDDGCGHSITRSAWLDSIVSESRSALAGVGYPMFTLSANNSDPVWEPAWRCDA